jgi:hypothetical protein
MAVSQIQSSIGWKKARRRTPEPGVAAQRSANFVVEMDFELIAAPAAILESWEHRRGRKTRGGAQIGDAKVQKCDNDSGNRAAFFSGMTGAQLRQLREDLGEAIGRPLSVNDFAKLCGLPPESGGGTILEWENGYGPIGPVKALLSLLAVASDHYPIDEEIISESDAAFYRAMMRAGIIRRIS